MIHLSQHQEYSARYGLKSALNKGATNAVEVAQKIAEEKYRDLMGRDIFISEMSDIHQLIEELSNWAATQAKLPGNTVTH